MKEEYKKAYFHGWVDLVQPLAVITAYNPMGEVIADAENIHRQEAFVSFLEESIITYQQIAIGAKDRSYLEWSACIRCPKELAITMAKDLEQDAIFWVEDECVFVVDCEDGKEHFMGGLNEMIVDPSGKVGFE